jgi:FG-GAP repeat
MNQTRTNMGSGLRKWQRLLGAVAFSGAISAAPATAYAFNSYPAQVTSSATEMGRPIATNGNLILAGAPNFGFDTTSNNNGDGYIGAAFLYQQGNNRPIRTYYGELEFEHMGTGTAISSNWLAITSVGTQSRPPRVNLVRSTNGAFGSSFTQRIDLPGAFCRPTVDMTETLLVVGMPCETTDGPAQVLVYPYDSVNRRWRTTPVKIVPTDQTPDPTFGSAVAVDRERIIIGEPGYHGDVITGAAYIFERDRNGRWIQVSSGSPRYSFLGGGSYGSSVDISGDIAVVGDKSAAATNGYVHFMKRTSSGWQTADYAAGGFPTSVAVSGDKVAIGYSASNGVLTYRLVNGAWTHMGGFYRDPANFIALGASLSLQGDFIAMGAPSYSTGPYVFIGAAYTANIWESSGAFRF